MILFLILATKVTKNTISISIVENVFFDKFLCLVADGKCVAILILIISINFDQNLDSKLDHFG